MREDNKLIKYKRIESSIHRIISKEIYSNNNLRSYGIITINRVEINNKLTKVNIFFSLWMLKNIPINKIMDKYTNYFQKKISCNIKTNKILKLKWIYIKNSI